MVTSNGRDPESHERKDEAFAASLAALRCGRPLLRGLLRDFSPREAWNAIRSGNHPEDPDRRLRDRADAHWPQMFDQRMRSSGISARFCGECGYPNSLEDDPDPPPILFCLGDPTALLGRPRVAIVGTRSATRYGTDVASELGSSLSSSGVVVVSGLATGIDAAAHAGAIRLSKGAPPVAVVATAIDDLSPKSTAVLRDAVADRGCIVSELPPGVHAERWRFADRNRLIAGLAHVVVVVECHSSGGSLTTVKAARKRSIDVMAVPGSIKSPASDGTNSLLADGALVVRDLKDVLVAVERAIVSDHTVDTPIWPSENRIECQEVASKPRTPAAAHVYRYLDSQPTSLEEVVIRSGRKLGEVAKAMDELVDLGLVDREGSWWWRKRRGDRAS